MVHVDDEVPSFYDVLGMFKRRENSEEFSTVWVIHISVLPRTAS